MRQRRLLRFAFGSVLMTTAACSAIAGLDGDFDVGVDAAGPNNVPDGSSSGTSSSSSGTDGNVADTGPGTTDTGPNPGDGGTPDADAEAKDACTTRVLIQATTSPVPEKSGTSCPEAPLCFNFNGNQQPPPYGWDTYDASGGTPVLVGSISDATRRLRGQVLPEAGSGTSSAVFIQDWNSFASPDFDDPLQVDAGSALKLTFLFLVTRDDRQADIMSLTVNGKPYGLTLYPDPCGGDARIAQSGLNALDPELGPTVQTGKWYLAEVHFNRAKDNTWSGNVVVGGVDGGTTNGIYIPGLPRDINATIGAGVINAGAPANISSTTIVDVDDIAMVYIPYNQ